MHHALKMYEGVQIKLYIFLNLALHELNCQLSALAALCLRKEVLVPCVLENE
jgi:hypothetical protein